MIAVGLMASRILRTGQDRIPNGSTLQALDGATVPGGRIDPFPEERVYFCPTAALTLDRRRQFSSGVASVLVADQVKALASRRMDPCAPCATQGQRLHRRTW